MFAENNRLGEKEWKGVVITDAEIHSLLMADGAKRSLLTDSASRDWLKERKEGTGGLVDIYKTGPREGWPADLYAAKF